MHQLLSSEDEWTQRRTARAGSFGSRVRKVPGADSIQFEASGYTLDAGVSVDAVRFRKFVARGPFCAGARALAW